MVRPIEDPVKRFWSKVNKTDYCWEWTAGINTWGYGCFWFNGSHIGAHRWSWIHKYGQIGSSEIYVCHKCDNTLCVRPSHLFLGSQRANIIDAARKGRIPGNRIKKVEGRRGRWCQ